MTNTIFNEWHYQNRFLYSEDKYPFVNNYIRPDVKEIMLDKLKKQKIKCKKSKKELQEIINFNQ